MEVLTITLVFEKRAISLYSSHLRSAPHPRVRQTLDRYTAADEEVYAKTIAEYGERMLFRAPSLSRDAANSRSPRFEKEQF